MTASGLGKASGTPVSKQFGSLTLISKQFGSTRYLNASIIDGLFLKSAKRKI